MCYILCQTHKFAFNLHYSPESDALFSHFADEDPRVSCPRPQNQGLTNLNFSFGLLITTPRPTKPPDHCKPLQVIHSSISLGPEAKIIHSNWLKF